MDQRISFLTLTVRDLGASRRFLEQARTAGAAQVTDAVERDWGGYSGYFVDPDGFRWEICHNPGEIGAKVLP